MNDQNYDLDKFAKGCAKGEKRKRLQQARRKEKSRQKRKRTRQKDWTKLNEENWEDGECIQDQRIMPRGETQRRKNTERNVFGTPSDPAAKEKALPALSAGQRTGVVTEVSAGGCRVQVDTADLICELRGSLRTVESSYSKPIAPGDKVIISRQDDIRGVVEAVLPRRNALIRQDVGQRPLKHILAANLDQVVIVASWRQPHFWPELTDRYLIAAERNQLAPLLCVNKIDLLTRQGKLDRALAPYRQIGVPILLTSAEDGRGIDDLRRTLAGKTTALAGLSGVGKSSLLNAAYPRLRLPTGAVGKRTLQGRHTTTQANLIPVDETSSVIDTPGIRQFGLVGLRKDELIDFYPDLSKWAQFCTFTDCSHHDEPACAVITAVANGEAAKNRLQSYQKILAQLPA